MLLASINVTLFAVMSLAQWAGWGGWYETADGYNGKALSMAAEVFTIVGINLLFGFAVVAGVFALRPMSRRPSVRYLIVASVSGLAALPRVSFMQSTYSTPSGPVYFVTEWVAGFLAAFIAVGAGVLTTGYISRARNELAHRLHEAERAAHAIEELQTEEIRVRRMVADQLHGTLQYRLVTVTAGLDGIAARLAAAVAPASEAEHAGVTAAASDAAAELRDLAERLEEIREVEVRALSHSVFPAGVELGAVTAIEAMMRRLPPHVATSVEMAPGYKKLCDAAIARAESSMADVSAGTAHAVVCDPPMTLAERLVAFYAVEEGTSNALRHGRATSVKVVVDAIPTEDSDRWVLDVTVDDDGQGLPAATPPEFSGLARHADRLRARGGTLTLTPGPDKGARLRFNLPFTTDLVTD